MNMLEILVAGMFLIAFAVFVIRRRRRKPPLQETEITDKNWWLADLSFRPPRNDDADGDNDD